MRTLLCATLLSLGALSGLQAGPIQHPLRLVNEQRVDLTPLFNWWTNHQGARPLTAWVHVTGSITNASAWGWVVQAHIQDGQVQKKKGGKESVSGTALTLLLKSPPTQDLADYETLRAQLTALEQEQAKITAAETKARNDAQALSRVHRNRAAAIQSRQAHQAEAELKSELKPLGQQIQGLKARLATYPSPEHYTVDCLALKTGETHDGLPIYDHGIIIQ